MEHTRKMALVDPRLLETFRPAPPTNSLDRFLRGLDGEMSSVVDLTDLDEGDKVKLYNQISLRYNTMADKHFKQPVVVNDDGTAAAASTRDAGTTQPAASSKPLATTGADADIVENVPKSLKSKADRLMKHLKNDPTIQWNDRGELILEGATISGSNMMDLIHDVLRKRKHEWSCRMATVRETPQRHKYSNGVMPIVGSTYSKQFTGRHRILSPTFDEPSISNFLRLGFILSGVASQRRHSFSIRTTNKSELLRRRYFDTKRIVSYGGVAALKRASRTPDRFVNKWLSEQDTYTLH